MAGPFAIMPQEPWNAAKAAKPDCVTLLSCGEVRTRASCKITRTWDSFNHREAKMFLLSEELWLIANNSKSIANGSTSMIRSNLRLCKDSEIYLTFKNNVKDLVEFIIKIYIK